MFTGIIGETGKLVEKRTVGGGLVFRIEATRDLSDPLEGESIAVNGVCLTARKIAGRRFSADVSPESLARTTLGELHIGGDVNMERALRLSDRLGGHIVSGHVDCVASLLERRRDGDFTLLSFLIPEKFERYIIEKGSIAVDGVSLTVNHCAGGNFSVSIIPHTLQETTLGLLKKGGKVNIEVDILGKYIEKLVSSPSPKAEDGARGMDAGFLAEHGFL